MISYSTRVTVNRPADEVFAALVDAERFHEWTPMEATRWLTPGGPAAGARGEFRITRGPITGTFAMEVVDYEPPRRVAFRITHPALDWDAVSTVEASPSGAIVTSSGRLSLRGWRRILEPLARNEIRTGEQGELERLKAMLERPAAGSAAPLAST
jgi:uncharacterized protein YndB with AHSA1/START domain